MRRRLSRRALGASLVLSVIVGLGLSSAQTANAADPSPPPPNKAHSPATNLSAYPKLPPAAVDPSLWGTPAPEPGVLSVALNSDGSGSATIYDPVAGESSATLYSVLRSAGVTNLRLPGLGTGAPSKVAPNTANSLTSCHYGTAQTFRCGSDNTLTHQIRWADGCCAHPQVWFVDHTGANWPVDQSAYTWNQAVGVDSIYVWGSCPGYANQHCVNVTDRNAGCSGWQGLTNVSWDANYYMTGATVQLNDYNGNCTVNGVTYVYAKNAYGYRQDACHEMGHALGMGHNSATNSCIYGTIINSAGAQTPDGNDFTLIAQLYADGSV
jgi:Matrixin